MAGNYVLEAEEIVVLSDEVRRVGEPVGDGLFLVVGDTASPAGRLGRWLEQTVFDDAFGGHTPDVMEREYGPWEDLSLFVVVVDHEGPAGCQRMIWSPNSSKPTKTESDLGLGDGSARVHHGGRADDPWWEFATTSIMHRVRGGGVLALLLGESIAQINRRWPSPFFAMITVDFYDTLAAMGFDIMTMMDLEPIDYLHVLSQPTYGPIGPERGLVTDGPLIEIIKTVRSRCEHPEILDLTDSELIDLTADVPATMPAIRRIR